MPLSTSTGSSPKLSTLASTGQSQVQAGRKSAPSRCLCSPTPQREAVLVLAELAHPWSVSIFQGTPVPSEDIARDLSPVCYWLKS